MPRPRSDAPGLPEPATLTLEPPQPVRAEVELPLIEMTWKLKAIAIVLFALSCGVIVPLIDRMYLNYRAPERLALPPLLEALEYVCDAYDHRRLVHADISCPERGCQQTEYEFAVRISLDKEALGVICEEDDFNAERGYQMVLAATRGPFPRD